MDWRAVGIGVLGAAVVLAGTAVIVLDIGLLADHALLLLAVVFVFMAAVIAAVEWRR